MKESGDYRENIFFSFLPCPSISLLHLSPLSSLPAESYRSSPVRAAQSAERSDLTPHAALTHTHTPPAFTL